MYVIRYGKKFQKRMVESEKDLAIAVCNRLIAAGKPFKFRELYVDVLVGNTEGDLFLVQRRVSTRDALEFHENCLRDRRYACCILWPHETPMPTEWRLVDDEEAEESEESPTSESTEVSENTEAAMQPIE